MDMDDKWAIFADVPDVNGNTTVRYTRSWTGYEQIALDVVAGDLSNTDIDAWAKIVSVTWEKRDKSAGYLSGEADVKETAMRLYEILIVEQEQMRRR